ncbi:MAG TPA: metallophosphoesterase family protein [Albidovulum sp.]|uniref:metallophosphoesterase family protein n=1 Tax=Albidovulum sp. TaxID=1872424 RepID=UPI002BB5DFA7|nr:metallophosphoesterase family protein [Albidovulum sp.]
MARYALLTDIHANREAFEAVLGDLARRGTDRIVILGDIVGYGPDPGWCVDRVRVLAAEGAVIVMGNHDAAIERVENSMNAIARTAIEWTRAQLDPAQGAFLAGLPYSVAEDDLIFVHASADSPKDWIYVTSERSAWPSFAATKARAIFCGHVHVPAIYSCDLSSRVQSQRITAGMPVPLIRSRRWLAVVGSVGQPRDGVAEAAYAIYDTTTNELTFRRVPYDRAATSAKVRAAGLPETLALRLLRGS